MNTFNFVKPGQTITAPCLQRSLPGYWSQSIFCEILPEWRAADAAEYASGKVHCGVLYNLKSQARQR